MVRELELAVNTRGWPQTIVSDWRQLETIIGVQASCTGLGGISRVTCWSYDA